MTSIAGNPSMTSRLKRLSDLGDQLEAFEAAVKFEAFRPELNAALTYSDGTQGGRPPFDPVMMFKILVIQTTVRRAVPSRTGLRCHPLHRPEGRSGERRHSFTPLWPWPSSDFRSDADHGIMVFSSAKAANGRSEPQQVRGHRRAHSGLASRPARALSRSTSQHHARTFHMI